MFFINFDFKKENKGEIIIENYPYEYDKNYNEKYLHNTKVSGLNNNWKIRFVKIIWENVILNRVKSSKIFIRLRSNFW